MNLKEYFKENKKFMLVMIIGTLIFTIQILLVVLYADDYTLGVNSKEGGFLAGLSQLKYDYFNWGGGPTSMFATMFLCCDIIVWKIFAIFIIVSTVYMITNIVAFNNKNIKWIIATFIWLLIFILDISISRETLYWLDGNLAYVFTSYNLLLFFYYVYSKLIIEKKIVKLDYILLPIVAFFAGWSGPQSGSIIILMCFLLVLYVKIVKKRKIPNICYISFIVSIIGFLIYYLAPGNSVRFEIGFPELFKLNKFELILYRLESVFGLLNNYWRNFAGIYFYTIIIFSILITLNLNNLNKDKKVHRSIKIILYFCIFVLISFLACTFVVKFEIFGNNYIQKILFNYKNIYNEIIEGTYKITMLVPYIYAITVIISAIVTSLYIIIKKSRPLLFISITSGFVAQLIMLIAPYSPIRTAFLTILLFIIAIVEGIHIIHEEQLQYNLCIFVMVAYFGVKYLLITLVMYTLFNFSKKKNTIFLFLCTLMYFSLFNSVNIIKGYYKNMLINEINVTTLKNYDGVSKEIKILNPEDENYGFTKLIGTEWVENGVKMYYNIPSDVKFIN